MALSCDKDDLANAAKCYCYDKATAEKVKIYLLAVIAGLDGQTPSQLADSAKCFCFDAATQKKVQAYLLCQAALAAGA